MWGIGWNRKEREIVTRTPVDGPRKVTTSIKSKLEELLWIEGVLTALPAVLVGGSYLLWVIYPRHWTRSLYASILRYQDSFIFLGWSGASTLGLTIYILRTIS